MGYDYALVHAKFTIPPALLLTYLYWPLFRRRDVYRLLFLVTVAVTATIPWDSYLIRNRIWSYPPHAVVGPTIFQIPLEELFFFIIQTYDVSMIYVLYTKATFYPAYLQRATPVQDASTLDVRKSLHAVIGQIAIFLAIVQGWQLVSKGGTGTYLGLIVVWAVPFVLLLWTLSSTFMLRIPPANVLVPIAVPSLYLWIVDTWSLQRGTWVIEEGTKCGIHLWNGLEVEEAFFFMITNVLIVFGQIAFDHVVTLIDVHPTRYPGNVECPSLVTAFKALFVPVKEYDHERITAMADAVTRLRRKSRSFFLASGMFDGRLRIDLVLLYSFCRVADDLVDEAPDSDAALASIERLRQFLDLAYSSSPASASDTKVQAYVEKTFPTGASHALLQLPVHCLTKQPLYDLLKGFEMDLAFSEKGNHRWPITDTEALEQYGKYVAGTVAELCCDLVFHHHGQDLAPELRTRLKAAAVNMGVALQTVNIARDIGVDAALDRVYIPTTWLTDEGLKPEDILREPGQSKLKPMRSKLLKMAFDVYGNARPAIEELPIEARAPMRVAIESYMEIGRTLKNEQYQVKAGRATVPRRRRIWVAWRALNS